MKWISYKNNRKKRMNKHGIGMFFVIMYSSAYAAADNSIRESASSKPPWQSKTILEMKDKFLLSGLFAGYYQAKVDKECNQIHDLHHVIEAFPVSPELEQCKEKLLESVASGISLCADIKKMRQKLIQYPTILELDDYDVVQNGELSGIRKKFRKLKIADWINRRL